MGKKLLNTKFLLFFTLFNLLEQPIECLVEAKKKVCLNMIVKDENSVIERCLASVLPLIDYWVIVDTGSTDGTQEKIKTFMQAHGIEGELYEFPWVNFAFNRNQALQLAKGKSEYLMFMDADDYMSVEQNFKLPYLDKDFYYVTMGSSSNEYSKITFINTRWNWEWVGVVHEVLVPPRGSRFARLKGLKIHYTSEGNRSKNPKKYLEDALLLENEHERNPTDTRTVFYLAQSYRDANELEKALQYYELRAKMGGWPEEVFYSLLQVALIQERLEMPTDTLINQFFRAYNYRKSRAEPLYYLARLYRLKEDFLTAYNLVMMAQSLPLSDDILFVQKWITDYGLAIERSVNAYWLGNFEECQQICFELLVDSNLPNATRALVEKNLEFAKDKLITPDSSCS